MTDDTSKPDPQRQVTCNRPQLWRTEGVHRMIFKTPKLNAREDAAIEKIEKMKGQLAYSSQPSRWLGSLRRNTAARAIRGSIGIEGFNVTVEDAVAVVDKAPTVGASKRDRDALLGYQRAMTFVLQKVDDPHFEYSSELLNALHFMMVGYDLRSHPGVWRSRPILVQDNETGEIVYETPGIESMPSLMAEYVESLSSPDPNVHPTVRAAMAHLNLVMIHPYVDGNGRMGRCLQTLALVRDWGDRNPLFTSIEEYLGSNTRAYYDALTEVGGGSWNPSRDARPWIQLCLTAHYRQAATLWKRTAFYLQLFDAVEKQVLLHGLPERCVVAVAEAAMGYQIRNATYRSAAGVAYGTASHDLQALAKAGLLETHGKGRSSHYVASLATKEMAARIPRPAPIEGPFD